MARQTVAEPKTPPPMAQVLAPQDYIFPTSFWPEASLPNGLLRSGLGDPLAFSMDEEQQNQQMLEQVVRTFGRQIDNLEIGEKFTRATGYFECTYVCTCRVHRQCQAYVFKGIHVLTHERA